MTMEADLTPEDHVQKRAALLAEIEAIERASVEQQADLKAELDRLLLAAEELRKTLKTTNARIAEIHQERKKIRTSKAPVLKDLHARLHALKVGYSEQIFREVQEQFDVGAMKGVGPIADMFEVNPRRVQFQINRYRNIRAGGDLTIDPSYREAVRIHRQVRSEGAN